MSWLGGRLSVAIVEDDPRLRKAFEKAVSASDDCRLAGMFGTGAEALAGLPGLAPDVILMDVNLPDTTGVECVAVIAPQLPDTQILMVTVYQDPETTFRGRLRWPAGACAWRDEPGCTRGTNPSQWNHDASHTLTRRSATRLGDGAGIIIWIIDHGGGSCCLIFVDARHRPLRGRAQRQGT